jgi:hypothetical protein
MLVSGQRLHGFGVVFRMLGLGFRVSSSEFEVDGFRIEGPWAQFWSAGLRTRRISRLPVSGFVFMVLFEVV